MMLPSAFSIPNKALAKDDLPEPDSPTKPVVEPLCIVISTFFTAFKKSTVLPNIFFVIGYFISTFRPVSNCSFSRFNSAFLPGMELSNLTV